MHEARTILVIEDIDEDFYVLSWAFEKAGIKHPVKRCMTAEETLAFLAPGGVAMRPPPASICLLDLNLPDADGSDVLRAVRRMYSQAELPVVIYSTASRAATVADCYKAGATSYVVKSLGLEAVELFAKAFRAWWLDTITCYPPGPTGAGR